MSGKRKFEVEKGAEDSRMSSDWTYNGGNMLSDYSMGLSSSAGCEGKVIGSASCASDPMMNCGPDSWNRSGMAMNAGNSESSLSVLEQLRGSSGMMRPVFDGGWNNPVSKEGFFVPNGVGLPRSLSELPSDLGFIERAARSSCFGNGNFSDMANTFVTPESFSPLSKYRAVASGPKISDGIRLLPVDTTRGSTMAAQCGDQSGSLLRNESFGRSLDESKQGHGAGASSNESDEAKFRYRDGQEELVMMERVDGKACYSKGHGANKRKKASQNAKANKIDDVSGKSMEGVKLDGEAQPRIEQNPLPGANHKSMKKTEQKSQGTDPPKEDYIHVRARRGQATNSHSLAERVRREKISERMKFLQDLVPGCSKVTGKAVMLDEIINYVQSLQRQVEFLSMKLATVNPPLDFDIESLMSKDMFQPRAGPSSSLGFPPDVSMAYAQLLPSQPPQHQAHLAVSGHTPNLRNTMTSHLPTMVYKELNPQLAHIWDDELHNIVHMSFGNSIEAANSQELDDSHQSGPLKSEP